MSYENLPMFKNALNPHQERRKNLYKFLSRYQEENKVGFESSLVQADEVLNQEEVDYLNFLIHKTISSEEFPSEALLNLNLFIESHSGSYEIIESEANFLIPSIIQYGYGEAKNSDNLAILLTLFTNLTCSEEVTNLLLDNNVLSILCNTLITDNPDRLKVLSLTCLHHIAAQNHSNCLKQFEGVQIPSDSSKIAAPVQCVMHVIDEQSSWEGNDELSELQSYLQSHQSSHFETDEVNVLLKKLCLKFLVALMCTTSAPYGSLLSEIVEHIVKSTFERELSLRRISLFGCVDCAEHYFDLFSNFFHKHCCFSHFLELLGDVSTPEREKVNILATFQTMLDKNPFEAESFANLHFIQRVQEHITSGHASPNEMLVWCNIVSLLLEIQSSNKISDLNGRKCHFSKSADVTELMLDSGVLDTMYELLCNGSAELKVSTVQVFQAITENAGADKLMERYPELLAHAGELLQCDVGGRQCVHALLGLMETLARQCVESGRAEDVERALGTAEVVSALDEMIESMSVSVTVSAKHLRKYIARDDGE